MGSPGIFSGTRIQTRNADRWLPVEAHEATPLAYHGVAVLGHCIYVVGGFDGVDYFNRVVKLDLTTLQWTEEASMLEVRCYVGICTLNGHIYAVGGCDGSERLSSAEKFDPVAGQWQYIAEMNTQRSDACIYRWRRSWR